MILALNSWCKHDGHENYEFFTDFNEWLDYAEEAIEIRANLKNFSHPSKALFAGDKVAYLEAFQRYEIHINSHALSEEYIIEQFGDSHWYKKNLRRHEQLLTYIAKGTVVPFIGAGLSVAGGFPTWKDHLRNQGKTAGLESSLVEDNIKHGKFEDIIEKVETLRGKAVFQQEIRDEFSKKGNTTTSLSFIAKLFSDTLITTNYDRLIERTYDGEIDCDIEVINATHDVEPRSPKKISIIKLHGDIQSPARCILGKKDYDKAYGKNSIDLSKEIPKLLEHYFLNYNLFFVGCSLNNDRTVATLKAIKDSLGDSDQPQHFSIEQAPTSLNELENRNSELLAVGITPIWYPKGQFEMVDTLIEYTYSRYNHSKAWR